MEMMKCSASKDKPKTRPLLILDQSLFFRVQNYDPLCPFAYLYQQPNLYFKARYANLESFLHFFLIFRCLQLSQVQGRVFIFIICCTGEEGV